jgi:hypothetical protein
MPTAQVFFLSAFRQPERESSQSKPLHSGSFAVFRPLRRWIDQLQVNDRRIAHFLCSIIPPQCPFERDISILGRKILHIPPLCKFNPLYAELVGLRFRALCYLVDHCGEDIQQYC